MMINKLILMSLPLIGLISVGQSREYKERYSDRNERFNDEQNDRSLHDKNRRIGHYQSQKNIFFSQKLSTDMKDFLNIINSAIAYFDFDTNILMFKSIQRKFGDRFLYTVLNYINGSIKDDLLNRFFPSDDQDIQGQKNLDISLQTYIDLLNQLLETKDITNDYVDTLLNLISNKLGKFSTTKIIRALNSNNYNDDGSKISEKKQDSKPVDDVFGNAFNDNDNLKELHKLIKSKNIDPVRLKAQFLLDIIPAFFISDEKNAEFDFLGKNTAKDPQIKIIQTFKNLTKQYEHALTKTDTNLDFLKDIANFVQDHMRRDHPQVTFKLYETYMKQIEMDQDLVKKIQAGYRIALDDTFNKFKRATDENKPVNFNTNIFYFLCLEVIAKLENSFSQSNDPITEISFKEKLNTVLQEIAKRFNHQGNIDNIVKSMSDAATQNIHLTDTNILFASTLYKLVTQLDFTQHQQNAIFQKLKDLLDDKKVTLDQVQNYETVKKNGQDVVTSLVAFDSNRSLMPFTVEKDKSSKENTEKDVTDSLQNAALSGLAKLFS